MTHHARTPLALIPFIACGCVAALLILAYNRATRPKRKVSAMKHWKTTLGGILAAVGPMLTASGNDKLHAAGVLVTALGGVILGASAADASATTPK